ncbi:MAG: lamin tail domain-containing protein [Winogradskyella sp.]|uniref:lamin tail domain-containing protein n=1 Tax=Winogradskyella sp. TaxID=1883156 RepID=UPI00385E41C3
MVKNYFLSFLFFGFVASCFGQVTIAVQDFETVPSVPTLNYNFNTGAFTSASGNSGGGDRPQNSPQFTSSNTSWNVINTFIDADFGPTDISGFESVQVEFNLAAFSIGSAFNGLDGADYVDVYISLDNGATWSYELEITGSSNARWAFNSGTNRTITYDGDGNPSSFTSTSANPIDNIIINIPDADAAIASNFLVGFVIDNNNASESWNIDDLIIEGTPSATNTIVQFDSATSTLTENGLLIDVEVAIVNPSATAITTVDITLDASSTAINGTDYDDGAGVPLAITFPQTLTFPTNSNANQPLTIFISNDDLLIEGDETVVLNLTNPTGGDSAILGATTQHILTIEDNDTPAFADVVITEIMYNTSGTDDEWIEICNVSGNSQTLNNYTIEVDGSLVYSFPMSGVIIADGSCITVILGDNGVAPFNPNCPFTSIYSNSPAANTLPNTIGPKIITITADDGSTIIDSVTYDGADGANGNDATLHVIDATADNSNTAVNWQEVVNGGSAGINQLVPLCLVPDINVEGDVGTFPDIASDGSNIPVGFNNTLFAATAIGTAVPPTKSYRIQNTGGEILNINSITLGGLNPGDFALSGIPATINVGAFATFDITFNPLAIGELSAIVTVISDDPDGFENPYVFNIKGTGVCTEATINVSNFAPLEGPVGTEVTIFGNGFSASSIVTIGGLTATVVSNTPTELVVEIPAITNSGPFTITEGACFTISSSDFTLTSNNTSCGLTELIMSEIYDEDGGSLGYIEIYNGTGNTIDLSSYYVRRYGDAQDLLDNNYVDYYFSPSQDFINDGEVLYGKISSGADTATPDFDFANVGGFPGINGADILHLYNGTTLIDVYTVPDNDIGYTATRDINTLGPNAIENPADWAHSNSESTASLGTFGYIQVIARPSVSNPTDVLGCTNIVEFDAISAASDISNILTYQWFYNEGNGTDLDWEVVSAGAFPSATISGINSETLILDGAFYNYNGYQFYCLVTEDGACGIASNAAQLKVPVAIWDGTNWNWNDGTPLNTLPNITTVVEIDGFYDTAVGGNQTSFSACSLTVNAGVGIEMLIQNNTFIEIQNDIIANGDITVFPQGSVVQINDLATVTANGIITVQKETSLLNTYLDYTYWSSPVVGETIENIFSTVSPNRRFIFNAANFVDNQIEIANTNTFTPGQDDIDDNGDDWEIASGIMLPGVGYAATPSTFGPPLPNAQQFAFVGAFNNGIITPAITFVPGSPYSDWNFIGNPYPSAIDTAVFFSENTGVANNIFLWSQATPADANASGDEGFNFSTADYAIINASGINVAGGDLALVPNNFVPSGQGFFIEALSGTNVTFNNAMRVTGDNDQFFRNTNNRHVLWLNLNSDNGVSKQIAVAHLEGASDNDDGSYYDVKENLSTGVAATIYSTILDDSANNQFVIQGKHPLSLDENEIIDLGFKTMITVPTLYRISIAQFEGEFYTENNIYLKDNELNVFHNLKDSDYTFTSDAGVFNERFQIVFNTTSLSIDDNLIATNQLSILELENGTVEFRIGNTHTITNVSILDITGRQIYDLKGNSAVEVYNLPALSKGPYIAKVTLSNGQVISKKAIKQH